jgi:hypothetical protein
VKEIVFAREPIWQHTAFVSHTKSHARARPSDVPGTWNRPWDYGPDRKGIPCPAQVATWEGRRRPASASHGVWLQVSPSL